MSGVLEGLRAGVSIASTEAGSGDPILFSGRTERRLREYGATILIPDMQSIAIQKASGKPFLVITHGEVLRSELARPIQVALFLDDRLFVPDSFGNSLAKQRRDLEKDTKLLRRMLNIPDVVEIIPRAFEATNVFFQIMKRIRKPLGDFMVRTDTQTHDHGEAEEPRKAVVRYYRGDGNAPGSLGILGFPTNGRDEIGVLRWIVSSQICRN